MIYLDSAATTFQKPPEIWKAVQRALETCASPGRGGYREAMQAAEVVFQCRERAAALFDCAPEQVVFTMNATHGLNQAIKDLVRPGDRVVVSGFEHNAVMRPLCALGARIVTAGQKLFDPDDTIRAFQRTVTSNTRAVICTHVSNVFGYILPIREIAKLCRKRRVPLILDASQSAGVYPVSLRDTGAAYIAMPGHKGLYGPQGTGILLCGRVPCRTLLEGGTGSVSRLFAMPDLLPDRLEAGTCNVPGIAGLAAGIDFVERTGLAEIAQWEETLCQAILSQLPDGVTAFAGAPQSGVLSLQLEQLDCETAAAMLAEREIAVRAGLQCAPLAHRSAGTLEQGTVRVSFSALNQETDGIQLCQALVEIQKAVCQPL